MGFYDAYTQGRDLENWIHPHPFLGAKGRLIVFEDIVVIAQGKNLLNRLLELL
jgi:hypothetical protein